VIEQLREQGLPAVQSGITIAPIPMTTVTTTPMIAAQPAIFAHLGSRT
jgi:hypothetical protein